MCPLYSDFPRDFSPPFPLPQHRPFPPPPIIIGLFEGGRDGLFFVRTVGSVKSSNKISLSLEEIWFLKKLSREAGEGGEGGCWRRRSKVSCQLLGTEVSAVRRKAERQAPSFVFLRPRHPLFFIIMYLLLLHRLSPFLSLSLSLQDRK